MLIEHGRPALMVGSYMYHTSNKYYTTCTAYSYMYVPAQHTYHPCRAPQRGIGWGFFCRSKIEKVISCKVVHTVCTTLQLIAFSIFYLPKNPQRLRRWNSPNFSPRGGFSTEKSEFMLSNGQIQVHKQRTCIV